MSGTLDDIVGKALADKLLEETPYFITNPNTGQQEIGGRMPNAVAIVASQFIQNKSREIFDKIWDNIDMDVLAKLVADLVVAKLLEPDQKAPWGGGMVSSPLRKELLERVQTYMVAELGSRAVNQLEINIEDKKD